MNTINRLSRLIAFDTTSRHSNLALIHDCADYLESLGLKPWLSHNADQSKAELTLPSGELIPHDRQGEEGNWSWQGGAYQLFPWKGYVLKSGERALFHGDSALQP